MKERIDNDRLIALVKKGELTPQEAVNFLKEGNLSIAEKEKKMSRNKQVVLKKEHDYRVVDSGPKNKVNLKSRKQNIIDVSKTAYEAYKPEEQDIAIIGMSGIFPGAENIEKLWENISTGVNSVTKLDPVRFGGEELYDSDITASGKTNCVYCGQLGDVEAFDASFFNISPMEAELIDPQGRLFLQESWKAFENAGYSASRLSGKKCAVYLGAAHGDYFTCVKESGSSLNSQVLTGCSTNMTAARISYYLNLNGANIAIDTACSSSLVALHEACVSLRNRECDMALTGGACVFSTADLQIMTSKGGMLSPTGKCSVFDNSADGFVPGEAVCAIVLKRLDDALRDHDNIRGVIKASAINYDGKTNGITAPSALSQEQVERDAYEHFGIDPSSIQYIETHGTGTKLGDPIEVSALKSAFSNRKYKPNSCALGSVKANVGHTLSVSGAVGIIKVLLCMEHGMLTPQINFNHLNEHIRLEESPFYINTDSVMWERKQGGIRRAAVSSFGLSGTNCHIVLDEAPERKKKDGVLWPCYPVFLSAKDEEALMRKVKELESWVDSHPEQKISDICFTLITGREHFNCRMAFVCTDRDQLLFLLREILNGTRPTYMQDTEENNVEDQRLDGRAKVLVDGIINMPKKINTSVMEKLCEFYSCGASINWKDLCRGLAADIIELPGYPFAHTHFWVKHDHEIYTDLNQKRLHPLITENVSKIDDQRYRADFDGSEFVFTDHIVRGKKILPGVAYLEMARAAVEMACGKKSIAIEDCAWLSAVCADDGAHLDITVSETEKDCFSYKILQFGSGELCAKGTVRTGELENKPFIDLVMLKHSLTNMISNEECYNRHKAHGVEYSGRFLAIKECYVNGNEALVHLSCPKDAGYKLHPAIMDGALQAIAGITGFSNLPVNVSYLPFSLDKLRIYGTVSGDCYAHFKAVSIDEYGIVAQIEIADEDGQVLAAIQGLMSKQYNADKSAQTSLVYLKRDWYISELSEKTVADGGVLIICDDNQAEYGLALSKKMRSEKEIFAACAVIAGNYLGDLILADDSCDQLESMINRADDMVNGASAIIDMRSIKQDKCADEGVAALRLIKAISCAERHIDRSVIRLTVSQNADVYPSTYAVSGLARSVMLENPNLAYKWMNCSDDTDILTAVVNELYSKGNENAGVRYVKDKRYICEFKKYVPKDNPAKTCFVGDGVYIITGGAGGLGIIFAKRITECCDSEVVLLGRSELGEERLAKLNAMTGSERIHYIQCDITNSAQVSEVVDSVKHNYGRICGVIHSAGVLRDGHAVNLSENRFIEVVSPKSQGVVNLDAALEGEKLDFFVCFSALASVFGNKGQCAYAYANAFLDEWCLERSERVKRGEAYGNTLSINWPLWSNGGMGVSDDVAKDLYDRLGMVAMPSQDGVHAFEQLIGDGVSNVAVIMCNFNIFENCDAVRGKEFICNYKKNVINNTEISVSENVENEVEKQLIDIFSSVLKLSNDKLKPNVTFDRIGIDSIIIIDINKRLEDEYGKLPKTLLFEYRTIESLAKKIVNLKNIKSKTNDSEAKKNVFEPSLNNDIAVVGISGRYPGAEDIEQFWDNLLAGVDSIVEIPEERWDKNTYFDPDKEKRGGIYSKWGGFISDVDKFDPAFFNIAPREAEKMDPQERLFLQTAYSAIEDAGYRRQDIEGHKVGVYVGVMYSNYQLVALDEMRRSGTSAALNTSFSAIANRVSYYFNLNGPSMAIDTMCSSSLTALHLACESIKRGETESAIVGGVNLSLHIMKYLALCDGKFLSTDGRCRTFGEGGNGYVPGEGVGAVYLKPLSKAVADGDNIYGVIKGTAINHSGRTNGFTVPNPAAQADVIREALRKSGVSHDSVTCIETHGTGTSLGDPIEITGLMEVYGQSAEKGKRCSIGSVKSNIGHLESAAGIAGMTKLLLELKNRTLVPSLHSEKTNSFICFDDTPFYVQQNVEPWQGQFPRRAGLSAFGAGGANAHIIFEEAPERTVVAENISRKRIFTLSAHREDCLHAYAERMIASLGHKQNNKCLAGDVEFTLLMGREAMEYRIAVIADSVEQFCEALSAYCAGNEYPGMISGKIMNQCDSIVEIDDTVEKLAAKWVAGVDIDWKSVISLDGKRISLPTYSFHKRRYWINSFNKSGRNDMQLLNNDRLKKRSYNYSSDNPLAPDWEALADQYCGDEVLLEYEGDSIAIVRMQDKKNTNTFSNEMVAGLISAFRKIKASKNIKAVVLTGYDNVFCMGGTKSQLNDIADQKCHFSDTPFLYRGLLEMDIPIISAMSGHASGGGMLFGLYGDIILMSEESVYSAVFTKYGFTPGMGATWVLVERFGLHIANEMMYTAASFTGKQLHEMGAQVIVKKQGEVFNEALRIARLIADKPLVTLNVLKREMSGRIIDNLLDCIDREEAMHALTFTQPEVKKRISRLYPDNTKESVAPSTIETSKPVRLVAATKASNNQSKSANNADVQKIKDAVTSIVGKILHIEIEDISETSVFKDIGIDSISSVEIIRDVNETFGIDLDAVTLYDYTNIDSLSDHIFKLIGDSKSSLVSSESLKTTSQKNNYSEIENTLISITGNILHINEDEVNCEISFREMGIDSISGVEIIRDVNEAFGIDLDAVTLYDFPTIIDMAKYIAERVKGEELPCVEKTDQQQNENDKSSFFFKSSAVYGRAAKENVNSERRNHVLLNSKNISAPKLEQDHKLSNMAKPQLKMRSVSSNHAAKTICTDMKKNELSKLKNTFSKRKDIVSEYGKSEDIAIIGMSGRFPGAHNTAQFWENLKNGVNSVTRIPSNRWDADTYYDPDPEAPNKTYSIYGGFLDDVESFDPLFFNISPHEAQSMDPQQCVFLEQAWCALEDAGYADSSMSNMRCGVFVGAAHGDFEQQLRMNNADKTAEAFSGTSSAILSARISYLLNLKGPSISIDTACSSSLVAIHQACQSLRLGESDMALAGGARLMFTPTLHIQTSKMNMLSHSGRCWTFDDRADGTIMSEGVGVVVLKPLRAAIKDGDHIYGVIKGSGVNQDGKTNGITAPSAQSQRDLELDVYRRFGIDPSDITYVEAHGTGTKLGDPIEVKALTESFREYTDKKQFCAIGSVKTNIGHTTMAAGVASVIKVLLSMQHQQIPPSINYEIPNEHIDFASSPFRVNTELCKWDVPYGKKRMAAVSAFGFSGTNCHIVIEEAPTINEMSEYLEGE